MANLIRGDDVDIEIYKKMSRMGCQSLMQTQLVCVEMLGKNIISEDTTVKELLDIIKESISFDRSCCEESKKKGEILK